MKCCGTCRWWGKNNMRIYNHGGIYRACKYPAALLPKSFIIKNPSRILMSVGKGKNCHAWEQKPGEQEGEK